MTAAYSVVSAVAGVVLGGAAGYAFGRRSVGNRRRFWLTAVGLVATCVATGLVGALMGYEWLRLGSLCAMAGAVTGLKYGGLPEVRIWETPVAGESNPGPPEADSSEESDVS